MSSRTLWRERLRTPRPRRAALPRSGAGARVGADGLAGGTGGRAGRGDLAPAGDDGRRAGAAQSRGRRRGLRQERGRRRSATRHRFRVLRDRRGDAAPADRQPAAAAVPAGRGPGRDQPLRLQQCRYGGGARQPDAPSPPGGRRRQPRREQGQRGQGRGLCRGVGPVPWGGRLRDHQRVLAQYREIARSAGARGAARRCWAACWRRATRWVRCRCSSRSRPILVPPRSPTLPRSASRRASTASLPPTRRLRASASARAMPARPGA